MASLVEQFRKENPRLDKLSGASTVDVEAEHSTPFVRNVPPALLDKNVVDGCHRFSIGANTGTVKTEAIDVGYSPPWLFPHPIADEIGRVRDEKWNRFREAMQS